MRLQTSAGDYVAHFRHFRNGGGFSTECSIHEGKCLQPCRPCGSTATTGVAHCNPKDNFDRRLGRRVALTRALAALPRATRTAIWRTYFRMTHEHVRGISGPKSDQDEWLNHRIRHLEQPDGGCSCALHRVLNEKIRAAVDYKSASDLAAYIRSRRSS
jgi:hypothetical protein